MAFTLSSLLLPSKRSRRISRRCAGPAILVRTVVQCFFAEIPWDVRLQSKARGTGTRLQCPSEFSGRTSDAHAGKMTTLGHELDRQVELHAGLAFDEDLRP